jgi:hypothetical protein
MAKKSEQGPPNPEQGCYHCLTPEPTAGPSSCMCRWCAHKKLSEKMPTGSRAAVRKSLGRVRLIYPLRYPGFRVKCACEGIVGCPSSGWAALRPCSPVRRAVVAGTTSRSLVCVVCTVARSGGFDDFGLLPELLTAIAEMDWLYVAEGHTTCRGHAAACCCAEPATHLLALLNPQWHPVVPGAAGCCGVGAARSC